MTEFKLGRIRFVWKSDWSSITTYYKDDIVRNGGNTYVCIAGHTSTSNFAVDELSFWNKISDGQEWKGNWTTTTAYKVNDIVKYGGILYIANEAHASAATNALGLENDQSKWDQYGEGFDYTGDWSANTRYKLNDIVKYNSTIYICNDDHTSAISTVLGLEADQSKWDIFSKGLEWLGDWTVATRYRVNDILKYGGQIYVCNTGHTSAATAALGLENDQSKWDYFHKGVEYKGEWASLTRYKVNDVVKFGGGLWICVTHHSSQTNLTDDASKWAQFVEGLEFEDSWRPEARYQAGDLVTYGGYSYVAITNNTASKPSDNPNDWNLFTTGFRFLGDWGDDSSNFEYIEGDVVRLGGYTYLCIDKHTGQQPPNALYWERLNYGIKWENAWTDTTQYVAGDAVRYGSNSYICVLAHTADETINQNRPDQDLTGTYWNLLAAGSESSVLTTDGDLLYYSGAGPARLPIGLPGQVLKVNSTQTAPEWAFVGSLNHIYYVSSNGVDSPAPIYGSTVDQPWKTVRYAAEQIEKGPLKPNSQYLLELNKSFIQEEVVEYLDATYTLTWSKTAFREDVGQIVDALIWDLSHGGNARSRTQTLTYFNEAGNTYTAGNQSETDDGINYISTLIDAILSNLEIGVDTGTKYGALTQFIDTDYVEESDAQSNVNSLVSIITDAITSGTTANVPAERKPNNTIFVKTGEFLEVLPIIVPENTAVVGDELRSTRISPAGSLIHSTDAQYSLGALSRLEAIMVNIVSNPGTITKTTGNPENPVTTQPAGSAGAGAVAADLVRQIYDYVDFGVNGASGDSTTPLTVGSNIPNTTTGYTYGVENIEANRDFIKAEIVAYIADTYTDTATNTNATGNVITISDTSWLQSGTAVVFSGTTFGGITAGITYYVNSIPSGITFTISATRGGPALTLTTASGSMTVDLDYNSSSCQRDVDRYLDAIKYDLIYTGNYKSLLSGRYYVNAVNGSTLEDMFYLRNATGLRNCTVQGLNGVLSADNAYGTKRPTAGAYASLDPGWGPDDTRVWITTRSPYVQNVTTFGTGCVGLKVDGNLHNGGNDSIVANDFTQVLSDGIGYWVTNLGRSELVSVFTYYCHIGYLAENGGKIRATNGNNSYGTFGSVAEGVDITETPIVGNVNNFSFEAIVDNVYTNSDDILIFEYLNAGVNYTSGGTTFSLTGEGFGATINSPVVRNGSVFEVRLLDTDVDLDSTADFGGSGYVTATNVAQGGNTTSITIANTDFATSGAYTGMAIYIVAGRGAGQYGYIQSYNAGTKVAQIYKMSDGTAGWDHIIGTSIESTLDGSTQYVIEPRLTFDAAPSGLYSDRAKGRAYVEDGKIVKITIWDPGAGYVSAPLLTITDPNNTIEVPHQVRIGNGVLGQPTWTNRGTGYTTAEVSVSGDGYADLYQPGELIQITSLTDIPQPGSSVEFDHLPGQFYKLVFVRNLAGSLGNYSAQFQISPELTISDAPEHNESLSLRLRYSQVRLTGHDFLDVGTGNFTNTNYPGDPLIDPDSDKEVSESGGGRVFYTSTDQDGNFRVGDLFSVEQSTGVATLNADAFNISGLQELSLGELSLGGTGATITEFSTDGTFTANSDNIVPTQKAIRTYITSQIGGGAATLNVNSITAGQVQISGQQITTTSGNQINVERKLNLKQGVDGVPVALNYFLLG